MDVTDKNLRWGLLPSFCMVGEGRLLISNKSQWLPIRTPEKSGEMINMEFTFGEKESELELELQRKLNTERESLKAQIQKEEAERLSIKDQEHVLKVKELEKQLEDDIELGSKNLVSLNAASDGIQFTADKRKDTRHFSNVLFNIMRGGIFDDNYTIDKKDFKIFLLEKVGLILAQNERL